MLAALKPAGLVEPHVQRGLRHARVRLIGVGGRVDVLDEAHVGRQTVLRRFVLRHGLVAGEPNDRAVGPGLGRQEGG
jgi:hypothetical protein